jgi:hypothetical protein
VERVQSCEDCKNLKIKDWPRFKGFWDCFAAVSNDLNFVFELIHVKFGMFIDKKWLEDFCRVPEIDA